MPTGALCLSTMERSVNNFTLALPSLIGLKFIIHAQLQNLFQHHARVFDGFIYCTVSVTFRYETSFFCLFLFVYTCYLVIVFCLSFSVISFLSCAHNQSISTNNTFSKKYDSSIKTEQNKLL